jgi:hypothetical protein
VKITVGTTWLKSFVTAGTFDGDTLSLVDANSLCSTESSGLGLGAFKAYLTDGATTAKGNVGFSNSRLVYDLRENYVGRIVSGSYEIFGQVRSTAAGAATAIGASYWTGSYYYGTASGYSCSDWTTAASNSYGSVSIDNGRSFTDYWGTTTCNTLAPVACIQAN